MKYTIWTTTLLIVLMGCKQKQSHQVTETPNLTEKNIPTISSLQLEIDTLFLNNLTAKIEKEEYPNIHSLLIAKNGNLCYEEYFEGQDEVYGRMIGVVQHTDSTLHDVRSVTKSVISASIGIAIDKGYIKSIDQKVSEFFPEMDTIFRGDKANWTIQDFLSMTTGLSWNEEVPYDDPENDEFQMIQSQDPVNYILSQPLESVPGSTFTYGGGATQALAEVINRSSKKSLDEFVKEYLFDPLGIEHFEWTKYSVWGGADKFAAASGLRLTSRDLMKIGLLYRNEGNWNGKQVIPKNWVKESFTQQIEFPSRFSGEPIGYGYQFWMWPININGNQINIVNANGNGGQNIFWDVENDLIVVTTAGNYNNWDIENDPNTLLHNEIYPLFLKENQ